MARTRFRTDRLAVLVGTIALLAAIGLYYVIQRGKLGDSRLASDKTLLSLLTVTIVGLVAGLAALLVRNLARVLSAKHRGLLGSRLQGRVTFAFLFLVLIPSLTLFISAIAIVRRSLGDLVPANQQQTMAVAAATADAVTGDAERRARHFAHQLAVDLANGPLVKDALPPRGALVQFLEQARRRYDLAAVGLFPVNGSPFGVTGQPSSRIDAVQPTELTRLPERLSESVFASGQPQAVREKMAFGWRVVAAEPLRPLARQPAFAWAAIYIDEDAARRLEQIARANAEITSLGSGRVAVERLYIVLFALVTLVVLVAAVWAGFLIARQVTQPILELARGTEALARGELSYRVAERSADEIGQLAASFNRMAREIERNRKDLEDRRRQIETLLEAIPVGVLGLDSDGRVSTVNRAALEVLRLEQPVPGVPLAEFLGHGRDALAADVAPVLAGETDRLANEVSIAVREGQVSLMVAANRFRGAGREGVLVVLEDLTRLRRAERLAAWGEVARRLAHEIKNPLTPIRLSAERMLRRFRKGDPGFAPVIEEGVTTIVREVESIQSLVSEFSRFARLPEIRPRPGALGPVVEDAVALYRGSHPDVDFRTETTAALPPHRIDAEALRRCLINLLDNAVAAIHAHGTSTDGARGTITVRTYAHAAHNTVALEVADNGPGIPAEDRKRLFQPDFTRRPGGTGLGLAIVEQIVIEHGGRIRVEDNPGGGSRLIIEIPAVVTAL